MTLPSFKLTRNTARRGTRLSDQLEHSRGDWLAGSSLPDCKMSLNAAFVTKPSVRTDALDPYSWTNRLKPRLQSLVPEYMAGHA